VWPDVAPVFSGTQSIWLDVTPIPEVNVVVGESFYIVLNEMDYFPLGYGWEEPQHEFACVNVLNKNFGEHVRGYQVWLVEAKG
jgi:hypothetical protein